MNFKKVVRVVALAIAGACVSALAYVAGAQDTMDAYNMLKPNEDKATNEPEEEEALSSDTQ